MKKLSDFSCNLKNKLSIYVPSTTNINNTIDNSAYVKNTSIFLSKLFGGCTVINAFGNWISDQVGLVSENINICFTYCTTKDFTENESTIIEYVKNLCCELSQECISVSFNNELFFIS